MKRPLVVVLVWLSATGAALAGMDDPGPYDALRNLTIEDAEALMAPICPGFRYPPGTNWRARLSGRAEVIDGDTLRVAGLRVRLATCHREMGMDAPELRQTCGDQPCGRQAREALQRLIGKARVTCQDIGTRPSFARHIMVCVTEAGVNLSAEMIRQGWAVEYLWSDRGYLPIRGEAARKVIGMWAMPFVYPWEWREARRTTPYRRADK